MGKLLVTSSPHIKSGDSTKGIMMQVVIALIPAVISGVIYFGPGILLIIGVTIAFCVMSEYIAQKSMKKKVTIGDMSAVLTGLLLALNLPPEFPLWMAALGGIFAIVIVKQMFGGIGQNFMNPALTARVILLVSFGGPMSRWVINIGEADLVTTATPLAMIKESAGVVTEVMPSYMDLLLGNIGGCIGEISALALILGGLYLIINKIISPVIPLTYLATTAVFTWIFGGNSGLMTGDPLYHVLSGGLMLGAFFMATDYSTSPITKKGKYIMGIGCGLLTGVIRLYTRYPEGVSFAILLMNVIVPLIERYTLPKPFGKSVRGGAN